MFAPPPGHGIIYLDKSCYKVLTRYVVSNVDNLYWCFNEIKHANLWGLDAFKIQIKILKEQNYIVGRYTRERKIIVNVSAVNPTPAVPADSANVVPSPEIFVGMECESEGEEVDYFSRPIDDIDMD